LPLAVLLHWCTATTIYLANQKNCKSNAPIHQQTTGTDVCPAKALIWRVGHIRQHTTNSQTLFDTDFTYIRSNKWMVTANDINTTLKTAVKAQGLKRFKLPPHRHFQSEEPYSSILIRFQHAQFRFLVVLIYIHQQIAALSHNVSTLMAANIRYHNTHTHILIQPCAQSADQLLDCHSITSLSWATPRGQQN
jgi:hypothetical protein